MGIRELISIAISSLVTNKLRTGLTMLGIIIGVSSVILISSLGQGAVKYVTDELSDFGANLFRIAPGSSAFAGAVGGTTKPLTLDDIEAIKEADIANINQIIPIGFASRTITAQNSEITPFIFGITPQANDILKLDLFYGEFLSEGNLGRRTVVLGSNVSDEIFGEDSDPVGNTIKVDGTKFTVVGVAHSKSALLGSQFNNGIIIPIEVLNRDITGDENLFQIDVSVFDPNNMNETIDSVKEVLREYRNVGPEEESDFTITSVNQVLGLLNTVSGLLIALIAGISGISLLVGGVGVMNIMLVSVTERTREIGLLKSIGAQRRNILMQFLIEAVVMSVIGGVIGIILGIAGTYVITSLVGIPFVISLPWILLAVTISSLVGIVFGYYPARSASKLSPIDALRYE